MARQRKRSVHGSGTVFQRKDGRWEARLKVEETGRYKSLYAATEKEAQKKLQNALFEQKQGALATGPDQLLKDFLEYWLEDVEKPAVRLGTYLNNRSVIRKHLIPGLGHIKLQKLTARQLQSFYARKIKEGMSANRVSRLNIVLHKALDHARRMKSVGHNVSEDVELPTIGDYEPRILTIEEANLLMEKARERDMEAIIALAVVTAMRVGEILGLRWSDFDTDMKVLQISRTLGYYGRRGFIEGKPKTDSGKRRIILPQFLTRLLKLHHAGQAEKRLRAGASWVDPDIVFNDNGGNFLKYPTFLRHFHRLLKDVGLPHMHFHDLRHSAAVMLLSMGVSPLVVQELLGHSDIKMTLGVYGHVIPSMRQGGIDAMEDIYRGKS